MKIEVIDHKFMVSGHSFLPNDTDFGLIRKKIANKTQYIYGPDDLVNIVKTAKYKQLKI